MVQRKPYPLYGLRKYTFFMFCKLCVKNVRIVSGFVKYFGDDIVKYFDDIKEKTMLLFGGEIKEN